MNVYVNVKQIGTRKNYITKQKIGLRTTPSTLRELIAGIVDVNVKEFNSKAKEQRIINYLTEEEIEDKLTVGKVSFAEIYNPSSANLNKALEAAFLAYEDGIFKVFIGEREVGDLDDKVKVSEGDILTFIRLTMLAGRMW